MMGHKICFYGEIWLIIPKLSLLLLLIWSTGPYLFDYKTITGYIACLKIQKSCSHDTGFATMG